MTRRRRAPSTVAAVTRDDWEAKVERFRVERDEALAIAERLRAELDRLRRAVSELSAAVATMQAERDLARSERDEARAALAYYEQRCLCGIAAAAHTEDPNAPALDLDLLAKLASGEGGRRTGALRRAGLLEWTVTPAGHVALAEREGRVWR